MSLTEEQLREMERHREVDGGLGYGDSKALLDEVRRVRSAVGAVLAAAGCGCYCGHDSEGHDDSCERCLACRIEEALRE